MSVCPQFSESRLALCMQGAAQYSLQVHNVHVCMRMHEHIVYLHLYPQVTTLVKMPTLMAHMGSY